MAEVDRQGSRCENDFFHRLLGTPLYMAPEQFENSDVDLRADLYALGTTVFHMLTGKPPRAAIKQAVAISTPQDEGRHRLVASQRTWQSFAGFPLRFQGRRPSHPTTILRNKTDHNCFGCYAT
jgi:serine/threonine protein kinase